MTCPPSSASQDQPENPPDGRLRLSLVREISYLRLFFFRLAFAAVRETNPAAVAAVVRNLSVAATAITRLVQTESWLAQSTGVQVQYDRLDLAAAQLESYLKETRKRRRSSAGTSLLDLLENGSDGTGSPEEVVFSTADLSQNLLLGLEPIARQLGIPIAELITEEGCPAVPPV